jgi:YHS domain-containing protein
MYRKAIVMAIAAIFICGIAFAMCGSCGTEDKAAGATQAAVKASMVKVNNTVCPVTGKNIDMNNPVTIDYKGETYNLCCPMCPAEFVKDHEKYSAIAKKQAK